MSCQVFQMLSADNVYNISLVDQCNTLKKDIGMHPIFQQFLAQPALASSIVNLKRKEF